MKVLEEEFGCPLAFDRERNGYYLKHHGWDFIAPALLDDNEMLAAVIGARISEDIFPSPLKNRIRSAADYLLQNNNPDFLDTADMGSLKILSGLHSVPDSDIFMTVYSGWQSRHRIKISYSDLSGGVTERVFEPHTLVFYRNSWYSKGFCCLKNAPRTFVLSRIKSAELLRSDFTPDRKIIDSVNMDDFLNFEKISGVRLKVAENAIERIKISPMHSLQQIEDDGTVYVPEVSKEVLFPYLLSLGSSAVLVEPQELRSEFKSLLNEISGNYR